MNLRGSCFVSVKFVKTSYMFLSFWADYKETKLWNYLSEEKQSVFHIKCFQEIQWFLSGPQCSNPFYLLRSQFSFFLFKIQKVFFLFLAVDSGVHDLFMRYIRANGFHNSICKYEVTLDKYQNDLISCISREICGDEEASGLNFAFCNLSWHQCSF